MTFFAGDEQSVLSSSTGAVCRILRSCPVPNGTCLSVHLPVTTHTPIQQCSENALVSTFVSLHSVHSLLFSHTRNIFSPVLSTVTVPPEKPVIKDASGEVLSSLIGPFNEGERLLLVCDVEGGKPRPSLTWWRESVLLDDSYEVTAKGSVRNELEIGALQRHDLMAVFTCQASNNNISEPVSSQVTVDLNFRPLSVHIEGDRQAFSAEKQVEVTCKGAGSRPPATVTWWKGSKQMKRTREKISIDGNVTTSILSFTPTADDSGKYLSCRAENQLIAGSAIEDGLKLEIHCKSFFSFS